MELSRSLLRSFARTINDDSRNKKVTNSMSGTVVMSGDRKFVKIDGSEALTPVFETVDIQEGDRVYVSIENHQASVIGNYSYPPSARVANQANAMAEQGILKVDGLIAVAITTENLTAHSATITNLVAQNINAGYAKITELDALKANIETLSGDVLNYKNATFEQLNAANGRIDNLSGDVLNYKNATFEQLEAAEGKITKLEGDVVSYKNATFEELEATKGQIDELNGNFISYKEAVFEQLEAAEGKITNLEGAYLEYKQAVLNELQAQDAIITNLSGDFASYKEVMAGELVAAKGWMLDGSIGNAQISNLDATKITSGIIDTSLITVKGSDGKLQIIDNTIQISDSNRVRVQIGKDSSNDYSMSVWDQNGLLIWDALGATENTIQRKIIRDKMVAEDAAIQALKIDFQSFETALTNQGVTISGTVVQVGDKTLNVELSEQRTLITDQGELLSDHSSQIEANETAIGLRVTSQEYETYKSSVNGQLTDMGSRMTSAESSITTLQGQISLKVEQTDITSAINGIKIGGRNLIRNSNFSDGTNHWQAIKATYSVETDSTFGNCLKFSTTSAGSPNYSISHDVKSFKHKVNVKYVLSFWAKASSYTTMASCIANNHNKKTYSLSTEWVKYTYTYTASAESNLIFYPVSANVTIYLTNIKLEEGSKATDWTPAPEDIDSAISNVDGKFANYSTTTQMQTAIDLSTTSILSSVSETYATKTEVDALETWKSEASQLITKDGIISTVGNYYAYTDDLNAATDRIAAAETVIGQHAESIELRVEKAGIISAINQTSESITIDAAKINLNGYVTMTDLSTKGKTTIVGDNITSGTITGITFKGVTGDFTGTVTADTGKIGFLTLTDNVIYGDNIYIYSGNSLNGANISMSGSIETPGVSSLYMASGMLVDDTDYNTSASLRIQPLSKGVTLTMYNSTGMTLEIEAATGDIQTYGYVSIGNGLSVTNDLTVTGLAKITSNGNTVTIGSQNGGWCHFNNSADIPFHFNRRVSGAGGFEVYNNGSYLGTGYIELIGGTPFIDFHFNNSTSDFTTRLIEEESGVLRLHGTFRVSQYLYMGPTNGGYERSIRFAVTTGTYQHHASLYGGNPGSTTAIGCYDNKNGRGIWYYNDVDNYMYVTPTIRTGSKATSWLSSLKGAATIYVETAGSSSGFNALATVRASAGAWTMGVLNSDNNFYLAYGNETIVTGTANQTSKSFVFGSDGTIKSVGEIRVCSVQNAFRASYGNYGVIHRNDGTGYYILLTNSGAAETGTFNSLRPFEITLSTGAVKMNGKAVIPPSGDTAIRGNGDATHDCGHTNYLWKNVYSKNGVKTTSDEREKDIMSLDLSELSDCFMSLEPIAFRWKYGNDKKIHLGVGAQTTERKMIEAGYDPSLFDMIQHDNLEVVSDSGLMERYGINYQDLNMLTMMQTQKNAREIQLINVDLSLFKDEQDELKEEVQNLKIELALANQKIAELSAKTA